MWASVFSSTFDMLCHIKNVACSLHGQASAVKTNNLKRHNSVALDKGNKRGTEQRSLEKQLLPSERRKEFHKEDVLFILKKKKEVNRVVEN